MTTFSISAAIGFLLFHTSILAADSNNLNIHSVSNLQPQQKQAHSGLDLSSVTASALAGYLDENSSNTYWPKAAAAIAISAGLQYTVDSKVNSISNLAITPYFTGEETGINLSFSFQ